MNSYSLDLRKKVFDAHNNSETKNKKEIGDRFNVSHDFVSYLLNLFNETESLEPKKRKVSKKPRLTEESHDFLLSILSERNDYILLELCEILNREKGIKVGTTLMFRALKKMNLPLKKVIQSRYQRNRRVNKRKNCILSF